MSEEIQKKVDDLVSNKGDRNEIHKILEKAYSEDSKDIEIVWRIARSYYMLGEEADHKHKEELYRKGLKFAKEGVEINKDHFGGHKWTAINLAALGDFESINEKIKNGYLIRDGFVFALKANAGDATVLFGLGKWCFSVANISTIQRSIASSIFSEIPTSSFDEAIKYLMEVEKILESEKGAYYRDLAIRTKVLLGDCYYQKSDYTNAKKWYQAALDQTVVTNADKHSHEEAQGKIKKCSSWW